MEGVSFWEWVAMYGLDGIGSGVLGGVIAWALLRRTINHEVSGRARAEAAAERAELRASLKELHIAARQMHVVAIGASNSDPDEEFDPDELEPALTESFMALFHSMAASLSLASPSAPGLAHDLDVLSDLLLEFEEDDVYRLDRLNLVCRTTITRLLGWMRSPEEYEALNRLDLAVLLAANE